MKTLTKFLLAGALLFAVSAANAQTNFGLNKHQVKTPHLEAKFVEESKTPTQNGVILKPDGDLQEMNETDHQQGNINAEELGSFQYDWTFILIHLFF